MRTIIGRAEWNKYYYHASQKKGQEKIEGENQEEENAKVAYCLEQLKKKEYINKTEYSLDEFLDFRQKVHDDFFIYWTAINPPMEHLLFALSEILKPKTILGIGIFTGNPVIWSLGPAIQGLYKATDMAAVEINKEHAQICQENMDKVSPNQKIKIHAADGFQVIKQYEPQSIDLLYLDANGRDPCGKNWFKRRKNTKRINYCLLKRGYKKIKDKGWTMCHNAYQPSFKKKAADYLHFTTKNEYFTKTATIAIDEMGLEFTQK